MSTTEYERLKAKYDERLSGFESAFSNDGSHDDPWTQPGFVKEALQLLQREEMAYSKSTLVKQRMEEFRKAPPYYGDRNYKARQPAVDSIRKYFQEQGLEFADTDGSVSEKKRGFYLKCEGVCPLHNKQHSQNNWYIYQPRETTLSASIICYHGDIRRRLSSPLTVFI